MRIFVWSYLFTQYGYGDNQDGANGLRSYPLDYSLSGIYDWRMGRLYYQGDAVLHWSSTIMDGTSAYKLYPWISTVRLNQSDIKERGGTLRCNYVN